MNFGVNVFSKGVDAIMWLKHPKRVAMTLLPVVVFFVLNLLGGYICAYILSDSIVGTIMGDVILFVTGGFWYYYMRIPFRKIHDIGKKQVLMFSVLFLFVWYSSQMGAMFIGAIFPSTLDAFHEGIQVNMTAYIILTILVAPAAEELMFRGVFYTQMRKLFGPVAACFVSTLIFSLMHSTPSQLYLAFICGILFCAVYELTNSMIYSVILHTVYNMLCVFIGTVVPKSFWFFVLMQVLMIIVVVYLFLGIVRKHKKETMLGNVVTRG